MTIPPFAEIAVIRAMIDYIGTEARTRHADLLRPELAERIANAPRSTMILKELLSSPPQVTLSMLAAYLDQVGHDLLAELKDISDDWVSPIDLANFENFAPCERQGLLDLIAPYHPSSPQPRLTGALVKIAVMGGDRDFLDRIGAVCGLGRDDIVLSIDKSQAFELAGPKAEALICDLLMGADFSSPPWDRFIFETLRKQRARSFALLVSCGWNPKPDLDRHLASLQNGGWTHRLHERLDRSRHEELRIIADFPCTSDVLAMTNTELAYLLGGAKPDKQYLRERQQKLEQSVRHFTDRGMLVPEGLQKSLQNTLDKISTPEK